MPWSNKDLKIKWEHFVSKLTPGGKETWTAVITGPNAKTGAAEAVAAEMVAGMYDASLDAFAPHAWANQIANLFYQDYSRISLRYQNQAKHLHNFHHSLRRPHRNASAQFRSFDNQIVDNAQTWSDLWRNAQPPRIRTISLGYYDGEAESLSGGEITQQSAGRQSAQSFSSKGKSEYDELAFEGRDRASNKSGNSSGPNLDQVSARTNLQETAFFYPHLTTGDNGEVRIEFTIPEALTKWKFLGFAHDADLRTAMLTDEITTSKDLMVQPNPPRFLREGDELEFSVKITNRSDKPQTGSIRLTLADAATEEDLNKKFGNGSLDQTFEVPGGQSKSVFWKLSVPDYVGVLTWKAVGATETLSDGEEGLLPVLSKRILVVESLPLPIRGNQTKSFDFGRLQMIDDSDSLQSQ